MLRRSSVLLSWGLVLSDGHICLDQCFIDDEEGNRADKGKDPQSRDQLNFDPESSKDTQNNKDIGL
jgi:hypothetical protein